MYNGPLAHSIYKTSLRMNLELEGHNCVAPGGIRGTERSIAIGLASEGANVAICARGEEAPRETESELREAGINGKATACDNLS